MRATLLTALLCAAGCAPAGSATYYVDWAGGDDGRAGTSPEAAWKHAPGDEEAGGRAAAASLSGGDRVIFRAGVPYRGSISIRVSGTEEAPITYTGAGWGEGMGIIDGSMPAKAARPCASAQDCGGAPNWQKLWRIEFTAPTATARSVLFGKDGLYWRSQLPVLKDPFFSDDRRAYATTSLTSLGALRKGLLENKGMAEAARHGGGSGMELAFWVMPNIVTRVPVQGVEGDALRFDPNGLRFYEDRDGRVALVDSFGGLHAPGTFLTLSPGVILAWPREGETAATLSVGTGRPGIDFRDAKHIRIDSLHFRYFVAGPGEQRAGMPVGTNMPGSEDVQVRGSTFVQMSMENGAGVVAPTATQGFRLLSSRIEDIQFGSGVRTRMRNHDLKVQGNVFRRLGRTAIGFLSVQGGEVSGNFLDEIRGIHGNAITAYLANKDVVIAGNCVVNSSRPLTFHGNKTPDVPNNIAIRNNILIATEEGQSAINGWGADTNGVEISGNVAMGAKMGILLNQRDSNVTVKGNDTNGIALRGDARADWNISGNSENLSRAQVSHGVFNEDGCEVKGSMATVKTSRLPR